MYNFRQALNRLEVTSGYQEGRHILTGKSAIAALQEEVLPKGLHANIRNWLENEGIAVKNESRHAREMRQGKREPRADIALG